MFLVKPKVISCSIWTVFLSSACFSLPVTLQNPGAEKVSPDSPAMPTDVNIYTTAGGNAGFSRDTAVRRSGNASFHILNIGHPDKPDKNYSAVFFINVDVVPGLTYKVSAYVRTDDTSVAGLFVRGSEKNRYSSLVWNC